MGHLRSTTADPIQGQRLAAFLGERPVVQIRPNIVPKIGDQPWAGPVLDAWYDSSVASPVKAAIHTRAKEPWARLSQVRVRARACLSYPLGSLIFPAHRPSRTRNQEMMGDSVRRRLGDLARHAVVWAASRDRVRRRTCGGGSVTTFDEDTGDLAPQPSEWAAPFVRLAALYDALSSSRAADEAEPGSGWNLSDLDGRSADEIMDAVAEAVRPTDGTLDAEAGREAIRDALSDLLGRFPDADLLRLSEDQRVFAVERYVAFDVYNLFRLDVGKTIHDKALNATEALSRLREVKGLSRGVGVLAIPSTAGRARTAHGTTGCRTGEPCSAGDLRGLRGVRNVKVVCAPASALTRAGARDVDIVLYGSATTSTQISVGGQILRVIQNQHLAPVPRAWDLLSIALSVVAADLNLRRDLSPDGWTRQIDLQIAVGDPDFWTSQVPVLRQQLRFLTTDVWNLTFFDGAAPSPSGTQLTYPKQDSVVLLSGGLDSLIGAIDIVSANGGSPYAVSQVSQGDKQTQRLFRLEDWGRPQAFATQPQYKLPRAG